MRSDDEAGNGRYMRLVGKPVEIVKLLEEAERAEVQGMQECMDLHDDFVARVADFAAQEQLRDMLAECVEEKLLSREGPVCVACAIAEALEHLALELRASVKAARSSVLAS